MKFQSKKKYNTGESLAEIILVIAVFSVMALAIALLVTGSFRGVLYGGTQTQGLSFARETWEGVQSIGKSSYANLQNGTYGLTRTNGVWALASVPDTNDIFTRTITIADSYRDGTGNLSSTGTKDINTKKVTTNITWPSLLFTKKITLANYFTNWDSADQSVVSFGGGGFSNTKLDITDFPNTVKLAIANSKFWKCAAIPGVLSQSDLNSGSTGYGVVSSGDYAYLVTSKGPTNLSFFTINKSDPAQPSVASSMPIAFGTVSCNNKGVCTTSTTTDSGGRSIIRASDGYLYVGTSDGYIYVIDGSSTPANPTIQGQIKLQSGAITNLTYATTTAGKMLFAGGVQSGSTRTTLYAINVTNPTSPITGTVSTSYDFGSKTVVGLNTAQRGKYIFSLTVDGKITVFDIASSTLKFVRNVSLQYVQSNTTPTGMDLYYNNLTGTSTLFVVTTNNANGNGEFFQFDVSTSTFKSTSTLPMQRTWNTMVGLNIGSGALTVASEGTNALIGLGTNSNKKTLVVVDTAPVGLNDVPISPDAPVRVVNQYLDPKSYNDLYWDQPQKMLFVASDDSTAIFQVISRQARFGWSCIQRSGTFSTAGSAGQAIMSTGTDAYIATKSSSYKLTKWDVDDFSSIPATPAANITTSNTTVNDIKFAGKFLVTATNAATVKIGSGQSAITKYQPIQVFDSTNNFGSQKNGLVSQSFDIGNLNDGTAYSIEVQDNIILAAIGSRVYKFQIDTNGVLSATGTPSFYDFGNGNTVNKIRIKPNTQFAYAATKDISGGQMKYFSFNDGIVPVGQFAIPEGQNATDFAYKTPYGKLWIVVGTDNNQGNNFFVYDVSSSSLPSSYLGALNAGAGDSTQGAGSGVRNVNVVNPDPYAFAGVNKNSQSLRIINLCGLYYESTSSVPLSLVPRDSCGLRHASNDPFSIVLDSVTNTLDPSQSVSGYIMSSDFNPTLPIDSENPGALFLSSNYNNTQGWIYTAIKGAAGASSQYVSDGEYEQSGYFSMPTAVNWNTVTWQYAVTPNCPASSMSATKAYIQVKTTNDATLLATLPYTGSAGTSDSYYTTNSSPGAAMIHPSNNGTKYLKYKATLLSDSTCTPYLQSVTFNYTKL